MATVKEANLPGKVKDAAANVGTMAVMSVGDTFQGTITNAAGDPEDWVRIELKAGMTYVITLTGDRDDATTTAVDESAEDPVLKLLDSKGGMIAMNDDKGPGYDALDSRLRFKAEEDGTYYISASSYTGNPTLDNSGNYSIRVTELDLPADIQGTPNADKIKGTDAGESIMGLAGNDVIHAGAGDDEVDGGAGDDLLVGGAGADMLEGGDNDDPDDAKGNDTASYKMSPSGVSINLRGGTAAGGDADGDRLNTDIENVEGSMYDDELVGSRGANDLWGLGGDDDLNGDRGDDDLYGGAGDDMLDGGEGKDTLEGGAGMDTLTGGGGMDTASYTGSMAGVTVRLHTGQAMGGDAEGDIWGKMVTVDYNLPDKDGKDVNYEETVPDIIHLTGSGNADILAGDSRANTLKGEGGDDYLFGGPGGGDDELHGGAGNDLLYGGHGGDTLKGDDGDDELSGGPGADKFYGGSGSDMIYADTSDTIIDGFIKDEDTTKEGFQDSMGKTVKEADDDVDTVSFERSKDGVGTSDNRWSVGTGDNDEAPRVENLIGSDENDWLGGDDKDNVIEGRDGADNLDGGGSPETNPKGDTVSYKSSDRGVTVNLTANTVSGGHAQGDTIINFENATGSAHSDTLTGTTGANTLKGLAGPDELSGGTGSDTLEGGAGADELDGGTSSESAGNKEDKGADTEPDTVSYESSDAGVNVNLATLSFSGGHAEGDEDEGAEKNAFDPDGSTGELDPVDVSSFENVTGSMHNDRLTGDHRANELKGSGGDDTLKGGAGADTLNGGSGADMLDGGKSLSAGGDTPKTDDDVQHVDTVSYAGAKAGVTVDLHGMTGTGGDAEGDTYVSIEKFMGSGHDDVFIASEGKDTIDGVAHTATSTVRGKEHIGGDTVSYEFSEVGVSVDLDATGGVQSNANLDVDNGKESYAIDDDLDNIENVIGSPGDDWLLGKDTDTDTPTGVNNNVLRGGAGDDTLSGGSGNDYLYGDAGDDILGARPARDLNSDGDEDDSGEAVLAEAGNDRLYGGAGNDELFGGAGKDHLYGGTGSDDLDGGGDADIFIFGHDKVTANDTIYSWNTGDKIDLTVFNIKKNDLPDLLSIRARDVFIDLSEYGGGTIRIDSVTDIDTLDGTTGSPVANDKLDGDFVYNDKNGDGTIDTAAGETDGVFIL